jgi:hypothetical protein
VPRVRNTGRTKFAHIPSSDMDVGELVEPYLHTPSITFHVVAVTRMKVELIILNTLLKIVSIE